jgi:hypothetical protein
MAYAALPPQRRHDFDAASMASDSGLEEAQALACAARSGQGFATWPIPPSVRLRRVAEHAFVGDEMACERRPCAVPFSTVKLPASPLPKEL